MALVRQIVNANVYLEGASLLGQLADLNLPEPETAMNEFKALGMFGTVDLPSGLNKLEMSLNFKSFFRDAFRRFFNPFQAMNLQIRASIEDFEAGTRVGQTPLVILITAAAKKNAAGNYKPQENAEFPAELSVYYMKIVEAGTVVVEIDVMANIWKVGSQDVLAQWRRNLGA